MSELLAEVDEAIKRERLENIWKKYGNLVLFAILALIIGTGVYSGYSGWKSSKDKDQTDKLIQAGSLNDPAKLVESTDKLDPGLAAIAKIRAAGAYMTKNDPQSALPLYAQVAADTKVPKEFRDLAAFMQAQLDAKGNPDIALAAFETQAADIKNPYRFHAHLESALILGHVKQDFAAARKHLDAILAEKRIPQTLNTKTNALSVLYALKEKK
jgi:hypothetical protein